jgi:hypothetical protein
MREYIIMIASIITALTVISTTCFKIYIFFRNLEKKYDEMNDILKNNTLFILKIAVLDDQLPLTDRLHAGELYMNLGGNGAVKKKYQELLKECN